MEKISLINKLQYENYHKYPKAHCFQVAINIFLIRHIFGLGLITRVSFLKSSTISSQFFHYF